MPWIGAKVGAMTTENPFDGSGNQNVPEGWGQSGITPPAPVSPALTPPASPTSPTAAPVFDTAVDTVAAPEAPTAASRAPWLLAVVGAFALLAGGGFFALSALGAAGGADSPEAAVDELIEALGNEDFVTMAELLEPTERRAIAEPVITEVLPELVRIGVFDDSVDAAAVDGVDFELTDVEYRIDPLANNPDLVHVFFTGGEFTSEVNVDALRLDSRFREFLGDDLEEPTRQVESIEDNNDPIVLVERDGRWYFSMMFTVAEAARIDAGEPLPLAADAPPALGSESPEAAVEAMFEEVVDLDLGGLIGRMDPEEMAVLYRYAPLFLADGQQALSDLDQEMAANSITWNISNFDLESEIDGDEAVVTIRGMDIEVESPDFDVTLSYSRESVAGGFDAGTLGVGSFEVTPRTISVVGQIQGESIDIEASVDPDARSAFVTGEISGERVNGEVTFDPDGECSTYSIIGPDVDEAGCLEDQGVSNDEFLLFFDQLEDEFPGASLTTRRVDGEWYVSPITTVMDGTVSWLEGLEDDAFTTMLDDFDSVFGGNAFPGALFNVENMLGGVAGGTPIPQDDFIVTPPGLDQSFGEQPGFDQSFVPPVADSEPVPFPEAEVDESITVAGAGEYSSTLTENTFDVYGFELTEGETLTITMLGDDDLDALLEVVAPDGAFFSNDDHEADLPQVFDSQIVIDTPVLGFYTIEARSFLGGGEGDYTLIIEVG